MKLLKILFIFLALLLITVASAAVYFNTVHKDRILPNVLINGEDYSNLTKREAAKKLNEIFEETYKDGFSFAYNNEIYKAQISEVGASIDVEKTIDNAFNYGHRKNFLQRLKERIYILDKTKNFRIYFNINFGILKSYINKEMSEIETPPSNFNYKYENGKFISIPAKSGVEINENKIGNDVVKNISSLKNDLIKVTVVEKKADIQKDYNNAALNNALNLLDKSVVLKNNSDSWEITRDELAQWISFNPKFSSDNFVKNVFTPTEKIITLDANNEKIKDYLISIAPYVSRAPVNAQLEFKNGKISVFSLSQDGIVLNINKSVEKIREKIFDMRNYQRKQDKNNKDVIEIFLVTDKIQPEITTESINNMGITSLLSTGESNFYGSPKSRKHNITIGANKFHGILIKPGEEFSFNKTLGKVGPREGYLPELVIKRGQTIPEYGGGLCQVSTTMFRAAVRSGLEITERKNHAYPVKYYNPQGTDATIYPPHPDLRFKNNTPAYILIQTRIKGTKLYFDFYGSDDGRVVEFEGPYVYDKKRDGSMKASWTQIVKKQDGSVLFEKTFYSNYKSPALYPRKNPFG